MSDIEIKLGNGKYTYCINNDGSGHKALRYGEEWKNLTGDNLTYCMGEEIQYLQSEVERLKQQADELEREHEKMLHEVACKYDGDDSTEWSNGANYVFRLFAKWVFDNDKKLKSQGE
tara:strand:+ start:118 stop:468 length:351 start_codon:yes stop_codon:yes gene_type:complete